VSREKNRVAVKLLKAVEFHQPDTTRTKTEHVENAIGVWDLGNGVLLAQVPLPAPDNEYEPDARFALSPNGRLLAVLKLGKLTLWRLP
jgi:hypothetical protein